MFCCILCNKVFVSGKANAILSMNGSTMFLENSKLDFAVLEEIFLFDFICQQKESLPRNKQQKNPIYFPDQIDP